jgi:hypothetical protein
MGSNFLSFKENKISDLLAHIFIRFDKFMNNISKFIIEKDLEKLI